jgi:hypothetical protein
VAALVLIALVVVAVAVGLLLARRGAAGVQRRVAERLEGLDVRRQDKANFYGLASAGAGQVRGLGNLVLTPTELRFVQFVPDREVIVPRSAITGVATASEFLGKTQGRELVVVAWTTPEGEAEEAAWDVPDVDGWRAALP